MVNDVISAEFHIQIYISTHPSCSLPSVKTWSSSKQIQLSKSATRCINERCQGDNKKKKTFCPINVREKIFNYIGLQTNAKMVELPKDIPVKVRPNFGVHSVSSVGQPPVSLSPSTINSGSEGIQSA
jgi:hypothetical protein